MPVRRRNQPAASSNGHRNGAPIWQRSQLPPVFYGDDEPGTDLAGPVIDAELVPERVDQIIQHEAAAVQSAQEAEAHRWEAARLISEELADGMSQRALAAEIGKSQPHVSYMAKCWAQRDNHGYHSFDELYHSADIRGEVTAGPAPAALESNDSPEALPEPETESNDSNEPAQQEEPTADSKPGSGKKPAPEETPGTRARQQMHISTDVMRRVPDIQGLTGDDAADLKLLMDEHEEAVAEAREFIGLLVRGAE